LIGSSNQSFMPASEHSLRLARSTMAVTASPALHARLDRVGPSDHVYTLTLKIQVGDAVFKQPAAPFHFPVSWD